MSRRIQTNRLSYSLLALIAACAILPGSVQAKNPGNTGLEVRFSQRLHKTPFDGRVIVFFNSDIRSEPRLKHDWLSRQPVLGQDVHKWNPNSLLRLDRTSGYPFEIGEIPAGKYAIQAVMQTNIDMPHSGDAPGNLYSKSRIIDWDPSKGDVIQLNINRKVKNKSHEVNSDTAKSVRIRSKCLSKFHGRDVYLRCIVSFPSAYEQDDSQKFPAFYVIPGFGGDERASLMYASFLGTSKTPFVRIGLDATCPLGHHVFADSDNNGPYGQALVEELIPHLEREFRLIPEPAARFLTGHSSGGWSSLWVQITHPDYFGGTWSTSPDSVDFHDFSGLDLYDPKTNFFTQSSGTPWPIMRDASGIKLLLKDFARMEDVIGPGGQLHSFESVFGPRGADGTPVPLWDRRTGRIEPDVIKAWRRFDITDKLRREWKTLGPKVAGKITVITGDADNFYLNGATALMKQTLAKLGSDARIIIEPGRDHGSVAFSQSFRSMLDEMSTRFEASYPKFSAHAGESGKSGNHEDN